VSNAGLQFIAGMDFSTELLRIVNYIAMDVTPKHQMKVQSMTRNIPLNLTKTANELEMIVVG
jgi:hypothetical protein